jgi:hypothetical protein
MIFSMSVLRAGISSGAFVFMKDSGSRSSGVLLNSTMRGLRKRSTAEGSSESCPASPASSNRQNVHRVGAMVGTLVRGRGLSCFESYRNQSHFVSRIGHRCDGGCLRQQGITFLSRDPRPSGKYPKHRRGPQGRERFRYQLFRRPAL